MNWDEGKAALEPLVGRRVLMTFAGNVTQSVDICSVDDEGVLHSGDDGAEPLYWTRFDDILRVVPNLAGGPTVSTRAGPDGMNAQFEDASTAEGIEEKDGEEGRQKAVRTIWPRVIALGIVAGCCAHIGGFVLLAAWKIEWYGLNYPAGRHVV